MNWILTRRRETFLGLVLEQQADVAGGKKDNNKLSISRWRTQAKKFKGIVSFQMNPLRQQPFQLSVFSEFLFGGHCSRIVSKERVKHCHGCNATHIWAAPKKNRRKGWSFENSQYFKTKKCYVYNTWCSQAVTHLSTNHARRCLTSVIGREPVYSTWYGRRHDLVPPRSRYSQGFSDSAVRLDHL